MQRLMIKYNLVCLFALCCAIFVACEPAIAPTDKSPMTFKNAQASPNAFDDAATNARLFAYSNTESDFVYGTAEKGAYAQLSDFDFTTDDHSATFKVKGETKYWTTGTYTFFSAYSTRFTSSLAADKEPQYDTENSKITFSYDITNQTDELWVAYLLNEESHISTKATVDLEFNPALAKVNFTIRKQQANANDGIKVTSVSLQNVYTSGIFNLNIDATDAPISWDGGSSKNNLNHSCDININTTATKVTDATDARNGGFLVIPQSLNQIKIAITYSFYSDSDCSGVAEYSKTVERVLPVTANVSSWEPGKNYKYNIILALETNNIMFETPTVETWRGPSVGGAIVVK